MDIDGIEEAAELTLLTTMKVLIILWIRMMTLNTRTITMTSQPSSK